MLVLSSYILSTLWFVAVLLVQYSSYILSTLWFVAVLLVQYSSLIFITIYTFLVTMYNDLFHDVSAV